MTNNLQSRKRQLVKDAIYDAAIDLFAQKGFDETTVEEVADTAGISRRSFFRYFATKDDLLALNTVHCGEVLVDAVASCPATFGPLEVARKVVMAGVKFTEDQKHTHQIVEIAARSVSARQAHQSRWMEVEDKLAAAYSARGGTGSKDAMRVHVFAAVTALVLNNAVRLWYLEEYKDLSTAAKQCFLALARLFCEESPALSSATAAPVTRSQSSVALKRSRSPKK